MLTQDTLIEYGVNIFSKMLGVKVTWEYAIIDENTPNLLVETILMAYDNNFSTIIVNPQIRAVLEYLGYAEGLITIVILSNIAHEVRHAWQYTQEEFKESLTIGTTFGSSGMNYAAQIHEIDAYAFQEAFLKFILEDPTYNMEIDNSISDVVITSIHNRANELYEYYKEAF